MTEDLFPGVPTASKNHTLLAIKMEPKMDVDNGPSSFFTSMIISMSVGRQKYLNLRDER